MSGAPLTLKVDAAPIARMANMFGALQRQTRALVMVRAVNHTGAKALTQMRRVLVPQTGLKYRTLKRAVTAKKAFNGGDFVIKSRGGDVRLKFFKPRETRKGVAASPWNRRKVYPGTFTKGGRFPKRVALSMGGTVLRRTGKSRGPLKVVRSGLYIPTEMVTGNSEAAFYATVERELPPRIAHELYRVLG